MLTIRLGGLCNWARRKDNIMIKKIVSDYIALHSNNFKYVMAGEKALAYSGLAAITTWAAAIFVIINL